jgi:ankyrin repeat protein
MASELIEAIEAQDAERVAAVVAASPEVAEDRTDSGVSALMYAHYHGLDSSPIRAARGTALDVFEAATVGDLERLRELLDEDAELVRARSVDTGTALHFAAFFGQPEAARMLLERGADPHAVSETFGDVTPLHSAAAAQNRDTVRALLAAGADPNARQGGGFTAVHAAAQNGDAEMLEDLLAAGADPTAPTDDGRIAADFAKEAGHDEIVARLEGA